MLGTSFGMQAQALYICRTMYSCILIEREAIEPEFETTARLQSRKIKKDNALFEVCKSAVYLPSLFQHYA